MAVAAGLVALIIVIGFGARSVLTSDSPAADDIGKVDAPQGLCQLLADVGASPVDWVDDAGNLTIAAQPAGRLAFVLSLAEGAGSSRPYNEEVIAVIRRREMGEAEPLSSTEREALESLASWQESDC